MSEKFNEQLEKQFDRLNSELEKMQAKQQEEINNIGEAHDETKEKIEAIEGSLEQIREKQKERLDNIEKKVGRLDGQRNREKSFSDQIAKAIKDNEEDLAAMAAGRKNNVSIQTKATMTTGNNYTGEVIEADRLSGVYFDPDRPSHVRQFIPQVTTDSDTVRYVQETSYTDNTAPTAEGNLKPESEFELTAKDAPVRTIANTLRLSKQMLDDTSFITSYINQRAPKKLLIEEDNQVLYGDGVGENLEGISQVAQSYSEILTSSNIDYITDVIANAIAQCATQNGEYSANLTLINPIDWWNIVITKDNDGSYVFPEGVRQGNAPMVIGGVRIAPNTAVTSGDFFVGDFMMGATMAMREGINLRFFEQDRDNVPKNLVTVRIEERLALPIHNPNAFVHDRFGTAGVS